MASWEDVRRIALALPEATEDVRHESQAVWRVRDKAFAWERPLRRGDLAALGLDEQPEPVLALRVADLGVREALVGDDPRVFFATPHFAGYPAVLVWLDRIGSDELREVLTDAWLARAPRRLARDYLDGTG